MMLKTPGAGAKPGFTVVRSVMCGVDIGNTCKRVSIAHLRKLSAALARRGHACAHTSASGTHKVTSRLVTLGECPWPASALMAAQPRAYIYVHVSPFTSCMQRRKHGALRPRRHAPAQATARGCWAAAGGEAGLPLPPPRAPRQGGEVPSARLMVPPAALIAQVTGCCRPPGIQTGRRAFTYSLTTRQGAPFFLRRALPHTEP